MMLVIGFTWLEKTEECLRPQEQAGAKDSSKMGCQNVCCKELLGSPATLLHYILPIWEEEETNSLTFIYTDLSNPNSVFNGVWIFLNFTFHSFSKLNPRSVNLLV
jgi:hypothetical protein